MSFKSIEKIQYNENKQKKDFVEMSTNTIKNLEVLIEQENRKKRAAKVLNPNKKIKF